MTIQECFSFTFHKGYPYEWVNGKDADYTNWSPGEPNDQDGSQNCVRMYHWSGEWDDYYCYEYYYTGYVRQIRQDLFKKGKGLYICVFTMATDCGMTTIAMNTTTRAMCVRSGRICLRKVRVYIFASLPWQRIVG